MATNVPVTMDTLIVIKVLFQGSNKRFKVPLKDLGPHVLPDKLRALLQLHPDDEVIFERYSDSAGAYVTLDSEKPQVYKTLFRAAKAKLKLRLRATLVQDENDPALAPPAPEPVQVPSPDGSSLHRLSADTLAPAVTQAPPAPPYLPSPPRPLSMYQKPTVEPVEPSPVSPLAPSKPKVEAEAPVPQPFQARQQFFTDLAYAPVSHNAQLALRPKENAPQCSWVVFCNHCNQPMEDEHFHCSICDHGDYDLCPTCVDAGVHCPGSGHWMVKRFVKNGCVVNSTTERVGPKVKPQPEQEMPGAFTDEKQSVVYEPEEQEPTRTCNCCVKVLREKEFVHCTACPDFDLCIECHIGAKHGHHPAHVFKPATAETTLTALADVLCNAGRNVRHSAVCDGCDKFIYGVRHKCLDCPDWDYCSECIKSANFIHPRHRFVPIYEPLAEPSPSPVRHYGIYCDGPLCKDKESQLYIEGVRYKCAVCHDTDFCANCEAIPTNRHNRTHPLIKLKTPVRSVSVTTMGEGKDGAPMPRLGDQPMRKSTATETTPPAPQANAATQVQTIVDVKPSDEPLSKPAKEKIAIRDLLTEPVQEKITVLDLLSGRSPPAEEVTAVKSEAIAIPSTDSVKSNGELDAHFIRDTIADGTKVFAGFQFVQVWTLRNPGPNAWPAGCSVRHVGGDNMLNLNNSQPLSQSDLAEASESNIVGRSVEPGEEISFRIVMKAPKREGTAISYWRLKTAEGAPFGHRLWCDIQVVNPPSPSTAPAPLPVAPASPEPVEASSSSAPTPNMTPYERFQQAKLERLKSLQIAQMQIDRAKREMTAALNDDSPRPPPVGPLAKIQQKLIAEERERQIRLREKLEREKMLRIQKVRKVAVERLLENRRKEHEAALSAVKQEKAPEVPMKEETAELPVDEKPMEPQARSSGMIFPQLEKESPASSIHEPQSVIEEPKAEDANETTTIAAPSEHSGEEEFFEDAESIEILASEDEAFMTDEEYDILDASDEERP